MRILLVENDAPVAQSIELMLKAEGFNVYTTDLGEEGFSLGYSYDYDAIVLELALSDMSGFEVIRRLRASKVRTPILVLSGMVGIDDKVRALGLGADDYLTKPFHKGELIARLYALARRAKGVPAQIIEAGSLRIDLDQRHVAVNGAAVHVTRKEYQMLEALAMRKGTTLTKDMLMNIVYGGMDEPEMKIIDVFMCKLRKKLRAAGCDPIETVWGRGYILRDAA